MRYLFEPIDNAGRTKREGEQHVNNTTVMTTMMRRTESHCDRRNTISDYGEGNINEGNNWGRNGRRLQKNANTNNYNEDLLVWYP